MNCDETLVREEKMITKRVLTVIVTVSICSAVTYSQNKSSIPDLVPQPQKQGDLCHVYVVDIAKAQKGFDEYSDTGNTQKIAAAQTTFPEFRTVIGEEELTTKTFPFPNSRLIITASIYYTDESMASSNSSDSMLVGVVVSPKAQKDAISAVDNAVSESTLKDMDTVRVKKYLKVNSRLYLVGVECKSGRK
jgi:hypothetical protein